jgi:hypothetical protein
MVRVFTSLRYASYAVNLIARCSNLINALFVNIGHKQITRPQNILYVYQWTLLKFWLLSWSEIFLCFKKFWSSLSRLQKLAIDTILSWLNPILHPVFLQYLIYSIPGHNFFKFKNLLIFGTSYVWWRLKINMEELYYVIYYIRIILLDPRKIFICTTLLMGPWIHNRFLKVRSDSKLMSGFPFVGHGNPDNNLESHSITPVKVDTCDNVERTWWDLEAEKAK